MGHKTPLYSQHVASKARMVDFGGWDMPLHYGSQLAEHEAVRTASGMFDVSHMTVIDVTGAGARDYLRRVFANDVERLAAPGRALYGCLLNDAGGIVDDLIVYWRGADEYRLVVNAATRDKDLGWLAQHADGSDVALLERRDLAMLAVQGPNARQSVIDVAGSDVLSSVKRFAFAELGSWFVARTGYTGEDGFEIILPDSDAATVWQNLIDAGVTPAGLGARDSLRLEAGLGLYGQDMTDATTPYESNLGWTVDTRDSAREFIGRAALAAKAQPAEVLTGLVMTERGVLRSGQRVVTAAGDGVITSGGFSPTLKHSVALARIPAAAGLAEATVEIRGKHLAVRIVEPPFVRSGKPTFAST